MGRGRRTGWTGRPRPQHVSSQGTSRILLAMATPRVVSPVSTPTSHLHASSKASAPGSIKIEELNRQTRVFKIAVSSTKQRTATCSNRQKIKFRALDDLPTRSSDGTAVRPAFRPFLTGSAPPTESTVTHSKQATAPFLTGSRTAIRRNTISTPTTQKFARVKMRNRCASHGFNAFLPGSAQRVESDVTPSKQTTAAFLPGATTPHFGSRILSRRGARGLRQGAAFYPELRRRTAVPSPACRDKESSIKTNYSSRAGSPAGAFARICDAGRFSVIACSNAPRQISFSPPTRTDLNFASQRSNFRLARSAHSQARHLFRVVRPNTAWPSARLATRILNCGPKLNCKVSNLN